MKKQSAVLLFVAIAAFVMLVPVPAEAQATRTWVSGVGDDANPCSRTAPCKTFAGAISKTAVNGEINCLDPGGFGGVTITKSMTIDCKGTFGHTLNAGSTGVVINFDSMTGGTDKKTVRLRHINFNGAGTGLNGVRILGTTNSAGSEVFIEDCLIEGNQGSPGRGIDDARVNGGKLFVTNTTVRNNAGTGIVVLPASGSTRIDVMLDHVRSENNNFGLAASNGVRAVVVNSVFSGNTNAGLYADSPGGGSSELVVSRSVTSGNGIGVQKSGGVCTVHLSDVDILFNTTGITGTTLSFGTNRIVGNGSDGTLPTFEGASSSANAQK